MPLGFARSILTIAAAGASEVREPATGQYYDNTVDNLYSVSTAWGSWNYYWDDVRVGQGSGSTPPDSLNTGGWTYYKGTQTYDAGSFGAHWGIYRIQD